MRGRGLSELGQSHRQTWALGADLSDSMVLINTLLNSSHHHGKGRRREWGHPTGLVEKAGMWINLVLKKCLALKSAVVTYKRSAMRDRHWAEWRE